MIISTAVEWRLMPPFKPELNQLFDTYIIKEWAGMPWSIISYPKEYSLQVRRIAKEFNMRIADGYPMLLGSVEKFPATGSNVFTVEDTPGSPVYEGGETSKQYANRCMEIAESIPIEEFRKWEASK